MPCFVRFVLFVVEFRCSAATSIAASEWLILTPELYLDGSIKMVAEGQ